MIKKDWPEHYPDSLKRISWCIDGEVAGVNAHWNRYIAPSLKSSELFVNNVMIKLFKEQGIDASFCKPYVEWLTSKFTFYMGYDETEFRIAYKKDKNKQPLFNKDEYVKMTKDILKLEKKEANELLRYMLKETAMTYNRCE